MKKNGRIILFICVTIFLLILGLFYLSYCNNYTNYANYANNIVENFVTSPQNPYTKQISYIYTPATYPQIYNDNVRKSNLASIYDVPSSDVNLCFGDKDGNNSLYTFPYIILVLRAYYLYNNDKDSLEYNHIMTVLKTSPAAGQNLISEYKFILENASDKTALIAKTGTKLIKACLRNYPNFLYNPTGEKYGGINSSADIFINNETETNFTSYPLFYIDSESTNGSEFLYKNDDNITNVIPQVTMKDDSIDPTIGSTRVGGVKQNSTKMYKMDNDNYINKDDIYCTNEWTQEFALTNNISKFINKSDICLKMLLNPFTGNIISCDFVEFDSSTLIFQKISSEKESIIYPNIIGLAEAKDSNNNSIFELKPRQFNASINKYVFDNCGRLYAIPTQNKSISLVNLDLTKIYKKSATNITNQTSGTDLETLIKNLNDLIYRQTVDVYTTINSSLVKSITTQMIDVTNNLPQFIYEIIHNNFNATAFNDFSLDESLSKITNTNDADLFNTIVDYSSSDGYIYLKLGNIENYGIVEVITRNIANGMVPNILDKLKSILLTQITYNSTQIETKTAKLQEAQTFLYNTMNNIKAYMQSILASTTNIPYITASQIASFKNIANSDGTGDISYYDSVKQIIDAQDEQDGTQEVETNKDNNMGKVVIYFESLLNTTTNVNGSAVSLFTKSNLISLDTYSNLLKTILTGNIITPPSYGDNLYTAKEFITLIFNSLRSLLKYEIIRQNNDIINAKIDYQPYSKAVKQLSTDNETLSLYNNRYNNNRMRYDAQNNAQSSQSTQYTAYNYGSLAALQWTWLRSFSSTYKIGQPINQTQSGSSSGLPAGSVPDVEPDMKLTPDDINKLIQGKVADINTGTLGNTYTKMSQGNILRSIYDNFKRTNSTFDINTILNNTSKIFGSV